MWQPGWEGGLGENGYMYTYSWAPALFHLRLSQRCSSAVPQYTIKNLKLKIKPWTKGSVKGDRAGRRKMTPVKHGSGEGTAEKSTGRAARVSADCSEQWWPHPIERVKWVQSYTPRKQEVDGAQASQPFALYWKYWLTLDKIKPGEKLTLALYFTFFGIAFLWDWNENKLFSSPMATPEFS